MKPPEFKHGVYRHFKGDLYRTLFIAQHHLEAIPDDIWMVVYVSLADGTIHTRDHRAWTEVIHEEARTGSVARQRHRFEWLSD